MKPNLGSIAFTKPTGALGFQAYLSALDPLDLLSRRLVIHCKDDMCVTIAIYMTWYVPTCR
jgi:hypothetical protein